MKEYNVIRKEFFEDPPDDNLDIDDGTKKDDDEKKYSKADMDKAIARRQAALKAKKVQSIHCRGINRSSTPGTSKSIFFIETAHGRIHLIDDLKDHFIFLLDLSK